MSATRAMRRSSGAAPGIARPVSAGLSGTWLPERGMREKGVTLVFMRVDAVTVSFNSRDHLRACVEPLGRVQGVRVFVTDNASTDDSVATIADLTADVVVLSENRGFGAGCNASWRRGDAPAVLFLNPDAEIDEDSLRSLTAVLEREERVGLVAPRILEQDGQLAFSQRRFPRLRSTYARALFLHRILPRAAWTDELVRDPTAYESPSSPEWVSGACMLVRRSVLEETGGFDERFFLYCEDKDLCRRIRGAGHDIRYEPSATVRHRGGASAPRAGLLPVLARSRVAYARKHFGRAGAALETLGVALNGITHAVVSRGGRQRRSGHLDAVRAALSRPGAGS
jgi:N-acetylglucosaminyl-diphospho-decaprenol L-rhamnosyltransferase